MTYEDWLYLHIIEIKPALAGWETCNKKQFLIIGFRHIKETPEKKAELSVFL